MSKLENIKNNFNYLNMLAKSKKDLRRILLEKGNKCQINSICECVLNTLNGNVKLESAELKKYRRYKNAFRNLINKKNTLKKKKEILVQNGGFISTLIPTILSTFAAILSK